jgi:hypothetical protein
LICVRNWRGIRQFRLGRLRFLCRRLRLPRWLQLPPLGLRLRLSRRFRLSNLLRLSLRLRTMNLGRVGLARVAPGRGHRRRLGASCAVLQRYGLLLGRLLLVRYFYVRALSLDRSLHSEQQGLRQRYPRYRHRTGSSRTRHAPG